MKCEESIRGPNTGLRRTCPGEVNQSGICTFKKYHLWTAKSGWCACGNACEGMRPEVDGVPQRTCRLWQNCPCKCHDTISQLLAPRKQKRVPFPDRYQPKEAFVVRWCKEYERKQILFNNPELRVRDICEKWFASDRSQPCTSEFIVSQTKQEKPMLSGEVERIFYDWGQQRKAFIGGEPMRFIKFMD